MKTTNFLRGIVLAFITILPIQNFAQNGDPQMLWVHEDHVFPGMEDDHNLADKKLIAAIKDANMNVNWSASSTQDGVTRYLMPIEGLSDIENFNNEMESKIDMAIMDDYKNTYSKHGDYVISLLPNLSYDPNGINPNPEGEDFRMLTYYHPKPGKEDEFVAKAKEIKASLKSKNSDLHYRVYKSGFGIVDNFYLVAIAAKSPDDYFSKVNEARNVAGDDFANLVTEIRKLCSKVRLEHVSMRPDISIVSN